MNLTTSELLKNYFFSRDTISEYESKWVSVNVLNQNKFNKICEVLESYIMRRMIVHATTKNYNNLFISLIYNAICDPQDLQNRLYSGKDSTTYMPSDSELEVGFNDSKLYNLQMKGILYLIESGIRPTNSSTALLGFNNYSLEHMMPKKWRDIWTDYIT